MILNTLALIAGFLAAIRLTGAAVMILCVVAQRHKCRSIAGSGAAARFYLLSLFVLFVLGLNVLSWPVLYLVLQSYVPEFPGVMCIYGVTRVGDGSTGMARFLPGLLIFLQVAKPALIFGGGAWFSLYALNRCCDRPALVPRLVVLIFPIAALTIVDAGAEIAYLVIPKVEDLPATGCCVAADQDVDHYSPRAVTTESDGERLSVAFYGGSAALALAVWAASRHAGRLPSQALLVLVVASLALWPISALFARDVAAPKLLGLPDHKCLYDLLPRVPEAVVAATLFATGGFSLGWAWVTTLLGSHPDSAPHLSRYVHGLLRFALWCYMVSVPMVAMELALA